MKEIKNSEDLRRLADLTSCPCYECVKNCSSMDRIASCNAYQKWFDHKSAQRELRRKYGINQQRENN